MYISCLLIDTGNNPDRPRPGRLWLRNLYRVHQRLCMAFPSQQRTKADQQFLKPWNPDDFPEQRHLADQKNVSPETLRQVHAKRSENNGFLFRIDPRSAGRVVIVVQSAIKPNWDYAFHNAAYFLALPPETKPFDSIFAEQQRLRFRLLANPTRKIDTKTRPDGTRSNGKRVPVRTEHLLEWLARRAEKAGFSIDEASTVVLPGYINMNKERKGTGQRLRSVRYDGVLTVTDPARFKETLAKGIGPGKAFGFGLLSAIPIPEGGI